MKKIILVTGANSGIGEKTARLLSTEGHIVYGATRKLDPSANNGDVIQIELDMTDYATLEKAVTKIIRKEGRIDVLFNNAGYGQYGSVEETNIEDAKYQFDVNLFGLARLTQLVLPHMRAQKSGTIINTSSMGGKMYTPMGAWYHATKHALEGWSDCLRLELKQFNIDVVIVEPGGIKTPWGSIAVDKLLKISGSGPYKKFARATAKRMKNTYDSKGNLSSPSVIAHAVSKAINAQRPKTRYVAGKYARSLILMRKYLGDRLFDRIVSPV